MARLRLSQQCSRILYIRGDANTAFFHQHARYRKKGNFIAKLQVGDRVITDQDEKHAAVLDFYDKLVGESGIHYWAFGPALERVAIQYSYTDLMDLIYIL